jgi:hypothetical protein
MINHYLIVRFGLFFFVLGILSCLAIENGINNHHESTSIPIFVHNHSSSARKELQADYNQHVFERPAVNRPDFIRPV